MTSELRWYVYLLRCSTCWCSGKCQPQITFYCGIALDPEKRLKLHNIGKGAKYTRGRYSTLEVSAGPFSKSAALKIEAAVKRKPAKKKAIFLDNYNKHDSRFEPIGSL